MNSSSSLLTRIGFLHPIIQAPMAGGGTTPAMVTAVSDAGALGFLAGAYLTPEQIGKAAKDVRARTTRPFGINLFAPVENDPLPEELQPALDAIAPFHEELDLPAPALPPQLIRPFDDQLEAVLGSGASVFSFTFGIIADDAMRAIRARGMTILGTATTVDEARALEEAGVDGIVAQGSEAGAHRATFAVPFERAMVGTLALVPQVSDAVRVPVVASGGIMDGRGIAAAMALGATAVQMGTAFLTTAESGIPAAYKSALLAARETDTRITRAFSGRAARGIANRFMEEAEARGPSANLGYPAQNALTRSLRNEAARRNRPEFLSLWAGQGVRLARRESAGELVRLLVAEMHEAIDRLAARSEGRTR